MTSPAGQRPARVAHLSTVHHEWDNRILNKECRALAEGGFDTHLVISAHHDRVVRGVQVHAIRQRSRRTRLARSQIEAWRQLRRLNPDLLHIHDPELIPLALLWGRVHSRPVVYDAHEDLVKQLATKPYLRGRLRWLATPVARALLGLADRGCAAIVTATESIRDTFDQTDRPVLTVRNLPWAADFVVADVANNPPVVVYTGDISEERGLSRMIAAVEAVGEQVPDLRLRMAGRALVEDERLGHHPQVDYCGLVPPAELPGVISGARVGLIFLERLPNYENSLPTKVFEYMASGVPFLATDFPAWRELFGDADAGVFVDTDDPAAVAAALGELISDPQRCAELGRNGRRAIEERFGFEAEAAKLVGVVDSLTVQR